MPPFKTRTDSPGETPEVPQDPCQHWRGILRFRHRLHTRSWAPASTERNPERPPSNSHGDWPFLRPPERVPEVPVVSQEHRPQLEKIQEVLPSRREELQGRSTSPRVPQMSQSFPEEIVYPALPRRSRGGPTHTMVARGTALWESLEGKPQIP